MQIPLQYFFRPLGGRTMTLSLVSISLCSCDLYCVLELVFNTVWRWSCISLVIVSCWCSQCNWPSLCLCVCNAQASSCSSRLPWAAVAGVELLQTEPTADAALLTAGQRLHQLHQHLQEGTGAICLLLFLLYIALKGPCTVNQSLIGKK